VFEVLRLTEKLETPTLLWGVKPVFRTMIGSSFCALLDHL